MPQLGLLMPWEMAVGYSAEAPVIITNGGFSALNQSLNLYVQPLGDDGQPMLGQQVPLQMGVEVFLMFVQSQPILLAEIIKLGLVQYNGKNLDFSKAQVIDVGQLLEQKKQKQEEQKP